ncbi:SPOR domain-containing protein [Candidatus Desulfovibrio trichonymphae]|uniref:SPOR domain-containing protein n=1 Tax=Candidatus Desulfovibrio trichonymphae TaxID=1725232 RepID=A0A1J1E1G2_9BACT|nr:SPOR domain-containing protein [Candidatus Desulfovibrio trichonymphae]BAV91715.1 conserved hypothetical protein [Candidatus Desulfovibrio trichonymphae]GHU99538.1 sporulation protein [Deltaproteobacteria bacterium]
MPQPLRKVRARNVSADRDPRRFTVRFSSVAVLAGCLVLAAAVGWAFYMGLMVGRGQNPAQRVGQMATIMQGDKQKNPVQEDGNAPSAVPGASGQVTENPQAEPMRHGAAAAPDDKDSSALAAAETEGDKKKNEQHEPFDSPQGEGWAAWGIRNAPAAGAPSRDKAPGAGSIMSKRDADGTASTLPADPKMPLFDYVFQVAAFKNKAEANDLCARLEGGGFRARQAKSGKVFLVLVSLRGAETDAANLREKMRKLKLGMPIVQSKKNVGINGSRKPKH